MDFGDFEDENRRLDTGYDFEDDEQAEDYAEWKSNSLTRRFNKLRAFRAYQTDDQRSGVILLGTPEHRIKDCERVDVQYRLRHQDDILGGDWVSAEFDVVWIKAGINWMPVPFWEGPPEFCADIDFLEVDESDSSIAWNVKWSRLVQEPTYLDVMRTLNKLSTHVPFEPTEVAAAGSILGLVFESAKNQDTNSSWITSLPSSPHERWHCRHALREWLSLGGSADVDLAEFACPEHSPYAKRNEQPQLANDDVRALVEFEAKQIDAASKPSAIGNSWLHGKSHLGTPRSWQRSAYLQWVAHGRVGIVEAVTGSGKSKVGTVAALEALQDGFAVLIVVPTKALQDQWLSHPDFLGKPVYRLGGDNRAFEAAAIRPSRIVVAVDRSVILHPEALPSVGTKCLLIADEVHHYGDGIYEGILDSRFTRRLGLTATLVPTAGRIASLRNFFSGSPIYEYSFSHAVSEGVVSPFRLTLVRCDMSDAAMGLYRMLHSRVIDLHQRLYQLGIAHATGRLTDKQIADLKDSPMHSEVAYELERALIALDETLEEKRDTTAALDKVMPLVKSSRSSIFFSDTVPLARNVITHLRLRSITSELITSEISGEPRKDILQRVRERRLKAVVSPRVLDEGIDIQGLELGVFVGGSRRRLQLTQRLGRVLRKSADKPHANVVVFVAKDTIDDPQLPGNANLEMSELKFMLETADSVETISL